MPTLTSDGQLVWTPGAERGGTVLTANGVEYLDRVNPPRPVARKSPYEPYQAATGFLVPGDHRWHRVAQPVHFRTEQLAVSLRTGDALVPSWGGELLLELTLASQDTPATLARRKQHATPQPALGALPVSVRQEDTVRAPLRLLLIADDVSEATAGLVCAALSSLSGDDQVAIVDSREARVLTPFLPYSHRSLLEGAFRRRVATHPAGAKGRDLPGALAAAQRWITREPASGFTTSVLIATDGAGPENEDAEVRAGVDALVKTGVAVAAAGPAELAARGKMKVFQGEDSPEPLYSHRKEALSRVLPPPPEASLREVKLTVSSSPAPARVIEATAGSKGFTLDEDEVYLDGLAAGEARTEMLRIVVPPFVPGEELRLSLRVEGRDAVTGAPVVTSRRVVLRYTGDAEHLSRERSGDVFAYASALALVNRLDRGLFGDGATQEAGFRRILDWERQALGHLAQATQDPSVTRRSELIDALSWSLDE